MNAPSTDHHDRFSLLRGPWHRSSRVVTRIVLLFLVFCNLPGQHVFWVAESGADRREHGRLSSDVLQHGWPLAYVTRSYWQPEKESTEANLFLVWSQVEDFKIGALALNVFAVLTISLLAGIAFEAWRRRRHRWQFHLRSLMAAILVVGLMGAWYANQRQQYEKEQETLRLLKPSNEDQRLHGWSLGISEGGITWVRRTVGDAPFQFLDRVVQIPADRQQLPHVAAFSNLAVLEVEGPISSRELIPLAKCRRLRWLELSWARPERAVSSDSSTEALEQTLDLPAIGSLRGVYLNGTRFRVRGLAQLQYLDSFDLSGEFNADPFVPDSQTMEDLARLPKLRELFLDDANLIGNRLEPLTGCRNLEFLYLNGSVLDEDSFRHLGRIHELRSVSLREAKFPARSIQHLVSLSHLEALNLDGVSLHPADYTFLSNLPVRALALSGETLDDEAIEHLKRMKHLRRLDLMSVSQEFGRSLSDKLPNCRIELPPYNQ